jgi:hypothetical protein
MMVLRRKRACQESALDDDMGPQLKLSDPESDPELRFLEQERHLALRTAVRRLPRLLREVTEICYFDEAPSVRSR